MATGDMSGGCQSMAIGDRSGGCQSVVTRDMSGGCQSVATGDMSGGCQSLVTCQSMMQELCHHLMRGPLHIIFSAGNPFGVFSAGILLDIFSAGIPLNIFSAGSPLDIFSAETHGYPHQPVFPQGQSFSLYKLTKLSVPRGSHSHCINSPSCLSSGAVILIV